ncbi:MAG: hypothetical protein HY796_07220, partial [Elusimicrobia bacterium]|nr:hypothetical protein [Elusimicrobiota bacterium]
NIMLKKTLKIGLWVLLTGIILIFLLVAGFIAVIHFGKTAPEGKSYEIGGSSTPHGWMGMEIIYSSAHDLAWITGFNYTDKFLYGAIPGRWFVITSTGDGRNELVLFTTEKKLKAYLAEQNVEIKKLVEVPIFKVPELSNGYYLIPVGIALYRGAVCYASGIDSIGVFRNFVVGKGYDNRNPERDDHRWFAMDMEKEEIVFKDGLKGIASFIGVDNEALKSSIKEIPDFGHEYKKKYKLPFGCKWGTVENYISRWDLDICKAPSRHRVISFVMFYKYEQEYIFGRAWHEYFIFNEKDEKCLFYVKKEDWLDKLKELGLLPSGFKYFRDWSEEKIIEYFEREPWLKEDYPQAKHI